MYYVLYVDSLFLVNFVMNLCLLLLVNRSLLRTATRRRMIGGAAVGAVLFFLPYICPGPPVLTFLIGIFGGSVLMILVSFPVRSFRAFLEIVERLLLYAVLLGGTMLLLVKKLPWLQRVYTHTWGILGIGVFLYLLFGYLTERKRGKEHLCKVVLINRTNRITLNALVDTGNSLVEPISGRPVSIIGADIVARLWGGEPEFFRAVPYHSIGRSKGILKAYFLQEMQIDLNGVTKTCKGVYLAVCEEYITSSEEDKECQVKIILNPALLQEGSKEEKVRERRKRKRKERFGYWYDIKGGSSG